MPRYYQVSLKMLPTIALCSKILPLPDSKPQNSFLQCDIPQTNCHAEPFFRTKKLDKSELKATASDAGESWCSETVLRVCCKTN